MSSVFGATSATSNQDTSIDAVRQNPNVSDAMQLENNFIQLMVAQIQNQDPTNPLDSTQFLDQYSAMSQVKSLENMTNVSKSNLVLMDNIQMLAASSLVGKDVHVTAEAINLGDAKVEGQFTLNHNASDVVVTLTDATGTRREISLGAQTPGQVEFALDRAVLGLVPGRYSISISTPQGENPAAEIKGRVENVRVTANGPELDIAGLGQVPFYNITAFGQIALNDLY